MIKIFLAHKYSLNIKLNLKRKICKILRIIIKSLFSANKIKNWKQELQFSRLFLFTLPPKIVFIINNAQPSPENHYILYIRFNINILMCTISLFKLVCVNFKNSITVIERNFF